jgi:hypothetical protein
MTLRNDEEADWPVDIVPEEDVYIGFLPLDIYRRLAVLAQRLDFKCTFNANGECSGYTKSDGEWQQTDRFYNWHVGSCCTICRKRVGYWDEQPTIDLVQYNTMDKLFGRYGFWRRGKGCILPWMYRSPTCLAYVCDDQVEFNSAENLLLEAIRLGINRNIYDYDLSKVNLLAANLGIINEYTSLREGFEKIIVYCENMIPIKKS